MVSLKNFVLLSVALVSAVPQPAPAIVDRGLSASPGNGPQEERSLPPSALNAATRSLEARTPGRMTLQYSPQGLFLFLLGMELDQAALDAFSSAGPAGPAKALLQNFLDWLSSQTDAIYDGAKDSIADSLIGGVYGKGAGSDLGNLFGFGLSFNFIPQGQPVVDEIRQAIINWAQRGGGVVQNLQRANGFYNPNTIGAGGAKMKVKRDVGTGGGVEKGKRSRTDQCPADEGDLLRFATVDAPDVDIDRDVRWGGTC